MVPRLGSWESEFPTEGLRVWRSVRRSTLASLHHVDSSHLLPEAPERVWFGPLQKF